MMIKRYKSKVTRDQWPLLWEMVKGGKTFRETGDFFGITSQRVSQIWHHKLNPDRNLNFCEWGKSKISHDTFLARTYSRREEVRKLYARDTYSNLTTLQQVQGLFFTRKRQNVKSKNKWDWDITMSDLDWPTHCPVFGIKLNWEEGTNGRQENSPSIDRINSNLGYIKGNVIIISWRANRIKNNGSPEEHRKIADFFKKYP